MLTKIERETHIWFNDEEAEAQIETCNLALMRKLDNYCLQRPEEYKQTKAEYYEGKLVSKSYVVCSKELIKFSIRRSISEDSRELLRNRFRNINSTVTTMTKEKKNEQGGLSHEKN